MPVVGHISVGDGATFTPSVSNSGVISWSNDKNLPNPASVDIAGVVQTAISGVYLPTAGGTVTGNLTVNGTITGNLSGNATTATTATTALSATTATTATNDGNGNVITATYLPLAGGTLTGNLTENSDLIVNGNAALNTISATGNATVGGALGVTGATTLASVSVTGSTDVANITASGDITADDINASTLTVSGASTLTGNITAGEDITVTGDLSVNDITASGDISADDVTANGNLSVVGNATLSGVSTAVTPAEDDNSTKIATTEYVQTEIKPIETDVTINDKRISNIEKLLQGNLYDYQTDSDSKYIKSVPNGAMPYASLDSVGGKTLVWNQLNDNANTSKTSGNITIIKDADNGTWTVNGTETTIITYNISSAINYIAGHKYLLMGCPSGGSGTTFSLTATNLGATDNGDGTIVTCSTSNSGYMRIVIRGGYVASNLVFRPLLFDLTLMFGAGNEPTTVAEFQQMFPASYYPYNAGQLLSAGVTSVISKDADSTTLQTVSIPAEIRALEGYGWSAGSVYNYIDYERKVFVKNVASVDLGTLNWTYSGSWFYSNSLASVIKPCAGTSVVGNLLTAPYPTVSYSTLTGGADKTISYGRSTQPMNYVMVRDSAYTTDVAFTSAMSGVYLYYGLATPQEIDISAYLTDDNLIEVEAGGTLTFPNSNGTDYQIPVPSAETYMVDLQSAL